MPDTNLPTALSNENEQVFLDSARLAELWAAIKTALGEKVDTAELEKYATVEAVAGDLATALTEYAKTEAVTTAITEALKDYMTGAETNAAIAKAVADSAHLTFLPVDALPDIADAKANVIYMVPTANPEDKNTRDEYMAVDGKWELLGTTKVDLSGYWSKDELRPMTSEELQAIINGTTTNPDPDTGDENETGGEDQTEDTE